MIQHCGICKPGAASEFQDEKYGRGNRVFNLMGKAEKTDQQARCTCCSKEIYVKGKSEKEK